MAARPNLSDSVRDVLSDGRHAWDGGEIFWVADLVKSGERVDSRREQSKRSARRHDVAEVADVVDVDTSVFASPRRLALLAGIVAIGLAYAYVLTPAGVGAKFRATAEFLRRKQGEYARLEQEIAALRREVAEQAGEDESFQNLSETGQSS